MAIENLCNLLLNQCNLTWKVMESCFKNTTFKFILTIRFWDADGTFNQYINVTDTTFYLWKRLSSAVDILITITGLSMNQSVDILIETLEMEVTESGRCKFPPTYMYTII